eukprot:CAMPEP_0173439340 /NCGR_PEP_ID=MMETSP1357-20121228/20899_1 /TAXON_ID=77926 /ORGANISM="Hemiselmis rufescens, Strain PCC563" /LENGTH=156 /DNA_ID=CAMNT_0014404699 /DNA_START=160 /DNA_END=627 /DNA_ORIENTATION=+
MCTLRSTPNPNKKKGERLPSHPSAPPPRRMMQSKQGQRDGKKRDPPLARAEHSAAATPARGGAAPTPARASSLSLSLSLLRTLHQQGRLVPALLPSKEVVERGVEAAGAAPVHGGAVLLPVVVKAPVHLLVRLLPPPAAAAPAAAAAHAAAAAAAA